MLRRFFSDDTTSPVDSLIDTVLHEMHQADVDSEEYAKRMAYLERLYELKTKNRREPISRDTIALAFTNLAGILLIVAYEQRHVMTSKALGQLIRPHR